MYNLLKKSPPSTTAYTDYVTPQPTSTLGENPLSFGADVNLINIVREHGPKRIQQIERELTKLDEQRSKLEVEQTQLERLVAALEK